MIVNNKQLEAFEADSFSLERRAANRSVIKTPQLYHFSSVKCFQRSFLVAIFGAN